MNISYPTLTIISTNMDVESIKMVIMGTKPDKSSDWIHTWGALDWLRGSPWFDAPVYGTGGMTESVHTTIIASCM